MNNYFKVLRAGTHSTFQDKGFMNVQHMGITSSGVMDPFLYKLSNSLLKNSLNTPVIEFSNQGPLLKLVKGNCRFVVTGNVAFNIISKDKITKGICNRTFCIKENEIIDILSTIRSNYGYLSIEGGFKLKSQFGSFSTLTQSNIGSNNGKTLQKNQKINFNRNGSKKISYIKIKEKKLDKYIRVIKGPQMNYFMIKVINNFFNKSFLISNTINRMGIRLEGNIIKSIKSHDIPSEGIINGSIQVPGNGEPIVLLNDHPTIGGYPKIATVIISDIPKLSQFPVGTQFFFKEITMKKSEDIFHNELSNFKNTIKDIINN